MVLLVCLASEVHSVCLYPGQNNGYIEHRGDQQPTEGLSSLCKHTSAFYLALY